ncbi:MAG: spermidine synthase [Tepidisphaerales bacterium]
MKPNPTTRQPAPAGASPVVPAPSAARTLLWLLTAAVTGAVVMSLELAAFRLYAPYFGYSIYVWGSMIGVIMAALAAGYAIGGWAADRFGNDRLLYGAIVASAACQLIMRLTAPSLLAALAAAGDISGPILATLAIFLTPMLLLACTGPFIIRLLARAGHVGSAAGRVYALSTLGSLIGVFGTSFYLVPTLGTRATLSIACALTAAIGIAGLLASKRTALLLATPLLLLLLPAPPLPRDTLWSGESAYNHVRVVRRRGLTLLILNRDLGAHTVRRDDTPWTGYYYDHFALGALLTVSPRRALVLGMGGGASIASLRSASPGVQIDAVEIDPTVVDVARRFFGLPADDPRLHVHIADARPWLLEDRATYDIVQVDLYQGGPYVPFYLATVEFFRLVRAHLADHGVLMMNLLDPSPGHQLLDATVATLRQVFPTVVALPCENGSFILCAFALPQDLQSVRHRLRTPPTSAPVPEALARLAAQAATSAFVPQPPPGTRPFTDDHSNIEQLTRRILADTKQRH